MADNFIVEKDGKKYVYRSTSFYDNQTKRKRTVSEYVGRIDPETGELIEKKSKSRSLQSSHNESQVRNYGACHAFVSISESCGIRDDLHTAFGMKGDYLLAEAISLILTGGPMYYIEPEMETNMSRELLGFGDSITPEEMHELVKGISDLPDEVERLFELRIRRSSDIVLFGRTYAPEPSSEFGWIDRGSGYSRESNYCIATDMDGIPVFFEPSYDKNLDCGTILRMMERLNAFGAIDPVVILDTDSGTATNLEEMVSMDVGFLVPARKKTPAIRQMLSQVVKKRTDPRSLRQFGDRNFIVYDTELVVTDRKSRKKPEYPDEDNDTADLELISSTDPRFTSVPMNSRMVAWASVELGDSSDNNREMVSERLAEIEKVLMDMDPYEAMDRIRDIAGDYSRFFDVKVVEGELDLKIRQKAVTAALNKEGIFVILTHGVKSWNDVMRCYGCRNRYENTMKVLRTNLVSGTLTESPWSLMDLMLTQYVALILWNTAEKRLRESGVDLPVSSVMQLLDTVMATGDGTSWDITEITPRSRKMFEALHVKAPSKQISSRLYSYEPRSYEFSRMNDQQRGG